MKKVDLLEFKCVSESCGKTIRPLTFFDGSIWCPECKSNLFQVLKAKAEQLTEKKKGDTETEKKNYDPDGTFALSQELFARYLCKGGEEAPVALAKAIHFCRKAAYELNPYALLNLGYYYSLGYDESVQRETGRAFAKLCFDIAKLCGPKEAEDKVFTSLVESNSRALSSPIEKTVVGDADHLNHLIEKMGQADMFVAPRLGILSIEKKSLQSKNLDKDPLIVLLRKLMRVATLYLIDDKPTTLETLETKTMEIKKEDFIKGCFTRNDNETVWFAYVRKGAPIGRFKSELTRLLGDKKEIKENVYKLSSFAVGHEIRFADFSDQDLLICTFINPKKDQKDAGQEKKTSPFDCLNEEYRKAQLIVSKGETI